MTHTNNVTRNIATNLHHWVNSTGRTADPIMGQNATLTKNVAGDKQVAVAHISVRGIPLSAAQDVEMHMLEWQYRTLL